MSMPLGPRSAAAMIDGGPRDPPDLPARTAPPTGPIKIAGRHNQLHHQPHARRSHPTWSHLGRFLNTFADSPRYPFCYKRRGAERE